MDRAEAIARIRKALKTRSGKSWSVSGGRGTAWGWLTIESPPKRRIEHGYMPEVDRAELGLLMSMAVHTQGISVPASNAHYEEYVARAENRPFTVAEAYWD